MKLQFLDLALTERQVYIEEASARRGLSPIILEKDFWVSWMLRLLFDATFAEALVFKGGTSLSKVFHVIERFSETSISPSLRTFWKLMNPISKPKSAKVRPVNG